MFGHLDFSSVLATLPYLFLQGATFTFRLAAIAALGGMFFGAFIAIARLYGNGVMQTMATGYVNLFRSIPIVLALFCFYVLMPYLCAWLTGQSEPVQIGAEFSAIVTFTVFESAYFAEIIRSGIRSVNPGQRNAGIALGLTQLQVMHYVVLPQAFRRMLPVLLTQLIVLFQDTSLVYVLSLDDIFGIASKVAQRDNRLVEMYLLVAVFYFSVSFLASSLIRGLQRKLAYS